MKEQLIKNFKQKFNKIPEIYFSPGRVNLIGEHTDYNNGFVMPIAINMGTFIAIAKSKNSIINVYSENLNENTSFDLNKVEQKIDNTWQNYIKGTLKVVLETANIKAKGADIYIYSNLPFGAGLSSSASLATSLAYAYSKLNNISLDRLSIAKIAQMVEHNYIGTKCGIMDQMACIFSTQDNATMIDCKDFSYKNIPFKLDDVCLIICDTKIKHNLAESAYNDRRYTCEKIAKFTNIESLREISIEQLKEVKTNFSIEDYNCAKHVFEENNRVKNATKAMKIQDWNELGELMYQSHYSLKNDYKVSCDELDYLIYLAENYNDVFGARMTGGGFGGSTIHLVKENIIKEYCNYLSNNYKKQFGLNPSIYISKACDGTKKL